MAPAHGLQESPEAVEFHKSQALGGRLTDIKDIAPLVEYLCTDRWINGQVIFCELHHEEVEVKYEARLEDSNLSETI